MFKFRIKTIGNAVLLCVWDLGSALTKGGLAIQRFATRAMRRYNKITNSDYRNEES